MKRLVTAIAGLSVLATGILGATPAEAFDVFGGNVDDDLKDIVHPKNKKGTLVLNQQQNALLNRVADAVGMNRKKSYMLLKKPNKLNKLYKGDKYDPNDPKTKPSGLGVYSKNGCTVEAGCAIKAIGLGNAFKCVAKVSNAYDPQDWAECVKGIDYDAYLAASDCTYGNCPAFATLPNQKVVACNKGVNTVLAGQSYLNLPATLVSEKKELQITWLSQG